MAAADFKNRVAEHPPQFARVQADGVLPAQPFAVARPR
jgi:hypothetical protein